MTTCEYCGEPIETCENKAECDRTGPKIGEVLIDAYDPNRTYTGPIVFEIKGYDPDDYRWRTAGRYSDGTAYLDAIPRLRAKGWKTIQVYCDGRRL